jgi:hypothetical protein
MLSRWQYMSNLALTLIGVVKVDPDFVSRMIPFSSLASKIGLSSDFLGLCSERPSGKYWESYPAKRSSPLAI